MKRVEIGIPDSRSPDVELMLELLSAPSLGILTGGTSSGSV